MKVLKHIQQARKIIKPMNDRLKESQSNHADTIIRSHVLWSMGAGAFIPLPILDSVGVAALQIDMVRQLCKVYGIDFQDAKFKAIISSITGSFLARAGAKSLIKLIPIAGTYIGAAAMGVLSGASTYTLGELFKNHFESGGTLLDLDLDRMKRQFSEKFEKNKEIVKKIKEDNDKQRAEGDKEGSFTVHQSDTETPPAFESAENTPPPPPAASITEELKNLADLKELGVISEKEFKDLKKKLIQKFS